MGARLATPLILDTPKVLGSGQTGEEGGVAEGGAWRNPGEHAEASAGQSLRGRVGQEAVRVPGR